ncbi:hypothetical protein [Pseudaestuariivita rosea]|uniref:hypothetical protein n=1 Tax=Pseudaestuariivita rosea TaxID=2763263 RepID=UPI001ABBA8D9|nr:hypothetical protein [Pseudaestuariivita rosea]
MQVRPLSPPVSTQGIAAPRNDIGLFRSKLNADFSSDLLVPKQKLPVPGLFRTLLEFVTPPRPSGQTINNAEIQIELRSALLTLEHSADVDDLAAASAIRCEIEKIEILQQQLNSLLKG